MAAGYAVTISAKDAASGTFDTINKRIEAMTKRVTAAKAPYERLGLSLEKLSRASGVDRIATGFNDLARAGAESFRSLLRVVEPLAAITGAASLAGMYKLVAAWGEFGRELANQANRAGLSVTSLAGLQRAAQLVGVSAESLTAGMTGLNDNMRNAAFGGAPQFINSLRNLAAASGDVSLSYAELRKLSPEQQLLKLADALKNVRDPTDRALLTRELFGGEAMIPFLRQGADGIQVLAARVRELAGVTTTGDIRRALEFARAQEELKLSLTGLGDRVSSVVGPGFSILLRGITELVTGTREWTEANQDWLRSEISTKAGELVTWLKSIDWQGLGHDIKSFAVHCDQVAQAFGGWKTVGETVLAFFAVSWLTGMLLPILTISRMLLGLPAQAALAAVGARASMLLGLGTAITLPLMLRGDTDPNATPGGFLPGHTPDNGPGASTGPISQEEAQRRADEINHAQAGRSWYERLFRGPTGGASRDRSGPTIPLAPGEASRNAASMDRVFREEGGLTAEASSALLGGGMVESGLNPNSRAPDDRHRGVFQWSHERQEAIEQHFQRPLMGMNADDQARAAIWELQTTPAFAGLNRQLQQSHDLERNNNAVTRGFESPGNYDVEVPHRLRRARGVHDALHPPAQQPLAPPVVAPAADAPAPPAAPAAPAVSPISFNMGRQGTLLLAQGEAQPLPSVRGGQGVPGATGKVDLNVRVLGAPTLVTAQASTGVGVRIDNPNMIGA